MNHNRRNETMLNTRKQICGYLNICDRTLDKFIREEGFPAAKIGGRLWTTTDLVDQWINRKLTVVAASTF